MAFSEAGLVFGDTTLSYDQNDEQVKLAMQRLARWRERFQFYSDVDGYESLAEWAEVSTFINKRLGKIQQALIVLERLRTTHASAKNRAEVEQTVRDFIDIQVDRLRNKQYSKLAVLQDTRTLDLYVERLELIKKDDEWRANVRKLGLAKRDDLKKSVLPPPTVRLTIEQRPRQSVKPPKPLERQTIAGFFKKESRPNISLKKAIKESEHFAEALHLAATTEHALSSIHNVARFFFDTSRGLKDLFVGIPIISAIALAVPIVLDTFRTWSKKTFGERFGTVIAGGIVAGAVVVTGTVAAAAAFITAGLVAIGSYLTVVRPYFRLRKKLKAREQERRRLENRRDALGFINKGIKNPESVSKLVKHEKDALLIMLERYTATTQDRLKEREIKAAKDVIQQGKIAALTNNQTLKRVLNNKPIHQFLEQHANARLAFLTQEAKNTRALMAMRRSSLFTSAITVIGAVMMLIPTPVTWTLGASMLAVGTLGGIAVKHQWGSKLKNFFGRLFGRKPDEKRKSIAPVEKTDQLYDQDLQAKSKRVHNVEADLFKRLNPEHAADDARRSFDHPDEQPVATTSQPRGRQQPHVNDRKMDDEPSDERRYRPK